MVRCLTTIILALVLVVQGTVLALAQGTPGASPAPAAGERWWQGALCYEIFVRSFKDSDGDGIGDLQGLVSKLDYLNDGEPGEGDDLGVTCIWLMPVMESPSYHGYVVMDYRAVESDYGTNADFRQLMEEAHARNIRVIIDLPINHTSSEHPWFREAVSDPDSPYRDWYIFLDEGPGYMGPWGQQVWHQTPGDDDYYYGIFVDAMPDLNFENPDVNAEIRRITAFWLTEMGVDGFRMDAIKHVIEDGAIQENTPATIAWLEDFSDFVRSVKPGAYTIGEVNGAGTDGLQPYYPDTLDQFFQFQLTQAMVNASNFGSARQLIPILLGAVERIPDQRWGTFLANHDQPRYASQIGGDPARLRVGAMMLLTFPGTPYIYYGEEIGIPGEKPDPNIRTPMQWSREPGGGFTTGTPYTPLQPGWEELNVAAQEGAPESVLEVYREPLREVHPALRAGDYIPLDSGNPSVLAFLRENGQETILVVINLGSEPVADLAIALPEGITAHAIDTLTGEADPVMEGSEVTIPALDGRSGGVFLIGG